MILTTLSRERSKVSGIYELRSTTSGKRYVGSSVDVYGRLWTHRRELRRNGHYNTHLQAAWNKYGEDTFEYVLLLECDHDNLLQYEQFCLDGWKPEYSKAISAERPGLGNRWHHTEEMKRQISASNKGKPKSRAHCRAIKRAMAAMDPEVKRRIARMGGLASAGSCSIGSGGSSEQQAQRGKFGAHQRWHVARNKTNPKCIHCTLS